MKKTLTLLLIIWRAVCAYAQQPDTTLNEPIVGKRCPDFTLDKIDFYPKKKVSLDDFKGKWLILDFWNKDCSSCIASFPKVSKEQEEFKDKVQFVMVTLDDAKVDPNNELNIHRAMYARYHKALKLSMPGAYAGTVSHGGIRTGLWQQFNIGLLPHIIIIDPDGIVRAVTTFLSTEKLGKLIAGESVFFQEASYGVDKVVKKQLNPKIPFEVNNNGAADSDFVFRSLLGQWKPGQPNGVFSEMADDRSAVNATHTPGKFEALSFSIADLYRIAYTGEVSVGHGPLYGTFYPNPILEVKDTTMLKTDRATGEHVYNYSLVVPAATKAYMLNMMQSDLHRYFGYDAQLETRELPYWRLIVTDKTKLKIRTGADTAIASRYVDKPWRGGTYKNIPFEDFFGGVKAFMGLSSETEPPVIDETGIKGNIDIDVEWYKRDYNSVRKALLKNGLDLVPGKKPMKVLVIRDPVTTVN